jgi:hypothetical protein
VCVGLLAGFATFACTVAFAVGFFLAGDLVAMTDPTPGMNTESPENFGIHSTALPLLTRGCKKSLRG